MIFIDCGAHCGESIILAKDLFGIDTIIYAFEPIPSLATKLEYNWATDKRVNIIQAAVSDSNGTANLYLSREFSDGSTIIPTKLTGDLALDSPIQVKTIRLADWIAKNYDSRDSMYVKLDIEGAEFVVLQDLLKSGQNAKISRLFVEWHDDKLPGQAYHEQRILLTEKYHKLGLEIEYFQPNLDLRKRALSRPSHIEELL